jgi:O-antigen ligase
MNKILKNIFFLHKLSIKENIFFYFFILTPCVMYISKFLADMFLSFVALYVLFKLFKNWNKLKEVSFFVILIIYFYLNSIFNSLDFASQLKSLALIRFPLFIIYPLFINYSNLKNNVIEKVFIILSFFTSIFCIDMIYQSIFLENILGYPADTSYSRISGFFKDELIAGGYLFFTFFIFLIYFKIFNKFNKFSILFLSFIYICIFISGDRNPFLMVNISILLLLIFNFKYFKNFSFFFNIFATFFLILLFYINFENFTPFKKYRDTYQEIINDLKNKKETEVFVFERWHYYDFAIKSYLMFKNNKYFGSGYKTYKIECQKDIYKQPFFEITKKKDRDGCDNHPHNFYLQILTEQGLIGLILFFLFVFNLINLYKKNMIHNIKLVLTIFVFTYFFPFKPSGSFYTNFNLILLCSVLSFTIFFNNIFKKNNIMRNY